MRRRRPVDDGMAGVPVWLREFDPAWCEVAATGPDGFDEATAAAVKWRKARLAWMGDDFRRDLIVDWLRAHQQVHRDLWDAAALWRGRAARAGE